MYPTPEPTHVVYTGTQMMNIMANYFCMGIAILALAFVVVIVVIMITRN